MGIVRSFSIRSLLSLIAVVSLVIVGAKSVPTYMGFYLPTAFVVAFISLQCTTWIAARKGWPVLFSLAVSLTLHPLGCWIVQTIWIRFQWEPNEYLRYSLVSLPGLFVMAIALLLPTAPSCLNKYRQEAKRVHVLSIGHAVIVLTTLWLLFPLDWQSPHWFTYRYHGGIYEENYVTPGNWYSISGGEAIRTVARLGNEEWTVPVSSLACVSLAMLTGVFAMECVRWMPVARSVEATFEKIRRRLR